MTNQLTQEELKQLAKYAGFSFSHHPDIALADLTNLAKFAQLIQQRQGEAPILKGIGKINGYGFKDTTKLGQVVFVWNREKNEPYQPGQYLRVGNATWTASIDQYDFSTATVEDVKELFNRLVAQAVEKALGVVANELYRDGIPAFPLERFEAISHGFRAIIDQPVDHIVDANKKVEPTRQESRQVEQGGDELVEALERIVNFSASQFFTMSDMAEECQNIARQAIANRRGRE